MESLFLCIPFRVETQLMVVAYDKNFRKDMPNCMPHCNVLKMNILYLFGSLHITIYRFFTRI